MPFDIHEFGRRLRAAREAQQLTQQELATCIQANRSWISGLETQQQKTLSAATVVRCAEALQVSADYLLGLVEMPERTPHTRPRRRRPADERAAAGPPA